MSSVGGSEVDGVALGGKGVRCWRRPGPPPLPSQVTEDYVVFRWVTIGPSFGFRFF